MFSDTRMKKIPSLLALIGEAVHQWTWHLPVPVPLKAPGNDEKVRANGLEPTNVSRSLSRATV